MAGNRGFRWAGSGYFAGAQAPIVSVPLKVSQTLYKGNAVRLSATAGHGSVGVAAEASTCLFGFVMGDCSSTATEYYTHVQVCKFVPGHFYEVTGAPATMTGKGRAYINKNCDLEIPTTGYHRVDTAGTTNHFRIVQLQDGNDAGATAAGRRWIVTPTPSASSAWMSVQAG